jgi:methylenetetrahydrofolate--tRNA-(uracil-5-)-methyltransferase
MSFSDAKKRQESLLLRTISGVEGYLESIASGYVAGVSLFRQLNNLPLVPLPRETAIGSLAYTISHSNWKNFCPTNFTFGLLESDFTTRHTKKERKGMKSERALNSLNRWIQQNIC